MSHGRIESIGISQSPTGQRWRITSCDGLIDLSLANRETLVIWMLHRDGGLAATLCESDRYGRRQGEKGRSETGRARQVALPLPAIARAIASTGAAFLIMAHNHPSGDPRPSRADIDGTRQVWRLARTLGASLHDHLVIGRRDVFSFRASGLL